MCAAFALTIAAPAIAEDSEKRGTLRARGLEEFDTDGDGYLSKEEQAAVRAKRHERRLEEFDTDGDGHLSKEEQIAARAKRHERRLEEFDTDGDGKALPRGTTSRPRGAFASKGLEIGAI